MLYFSSYLGALDLFFSQASLISMHIFWDCLDSLSFNTLLTVIYENRLAKIWAGQPKAMQNLIGSIGSATKPWLPL
jgi:hypothetical protein